MKLQLVVFALVAMLASACSGDSGKAEDQGVDSRSRDAGVDVAADSEPADAGCSSAADLQPSVPCAPNAGAICPAGHACYGGRECRPVPCETGGFCSGKLPAQAVVAQTYVPTAVEGVVTIASDGGSFTIGDPSGPTLTVDVLAPGLTLPFTAGQQLKAELCLAEPSPTSIGYLLVVRDAQDALLLVSGNGSDASTAVCLPAALEIRHHESGCRPFPAPPPDTGGHWARFAFEIGGQLVEPGQGAKSFTLGGGTYQARVFEAYWFVEWQSPGTVGAYESFIVVRQ